MSRDYDQEEAGYEDQPKTKIIEKVKAEPAAQEAVPMDVVKADPAEDLESQDMEISNSP